MSKLRVLGDRVAVKSRGIEEIMECGLVIPKQYLRNSDVCKTQEGNTVIIRAHSGAPAPDGWMIVPNKDILADIVEGKISPRKGVLHVRKCLDADDGIARTTERNSQFVEILAAHERSDAKIGYLGYVDTDALNIQGVEEGFDEWLIGESEIIFYVCD